MDDDLDNAMEEFRQEIADAQGYRQRDGGAKDEDMSRTKGPLNLKTPRKILIYGGIGILFLILLIALFSGSGDKSFKDDLLFIKAKFDQIEGRLTHIEEIEVKVAHLEKQQKELQQSIKKAVVSGKDLAEQMESLSQTVEKLDQGIAPPVSVKTEDPGATQKQSISGEKKRFHEVRAGENLYRIAKTYGITLDELCRLNNMSPNQAIQPGQKLLLAPSSNQ